MLGHSLKPVSIKVTINCTFWGGTGKCQCGGRGGGKRVARTYHRRGIVAVGGKVLEHKPYPTSRGDLS